MTLSCIQQLHDLPLLLKGFPGDAGGGGAEVAPPLPPPNRPPLLAPALVFATDHPAEQQALVADTDCPYSIIVVEICEGQTNCPDSSR